MVHIPILDRNGASLEENKLDLDASSMDFEDDSRAEELN